MLERHTGRKLSAGSLLREEHGNLYRPGGNVKAVLVFPNSYYLGMSSLGFQVVCHEINQHPDASCERAFLEESQESCVSFETRQPLSGFDIIGFSVSFELDYFNVLRALHTAKIPLKAKDRGSEDPVIIAGGICASFNPEPLASFMDAFVVGDGEEAVHDVIYEYQDWRSTRKDRHDLLLRLSAIRGVYVPLLYDVAYREDGILSGIYPQRDVKPKIERRIVSELDKFDATSKILTPNTEFVNTFLVEVIRGCAHRCRFCVSSHIQGCRIRSAEKVLEAISGSDLLAQARSADRPYRIGLVGSSVTDHSQIDKIATSLVDAGNRISIASMRADSVSDALLDALASSDQETITLAPEAASDRLRRAIGKDIPLEAVFQVIKLALKKGITNVKLYFMVGLPAETPEDVDSIITVVERIRRLMFTSPRPLASKLPRLTISISPFVPKPHIPFQWLPMEDVEILSRKIQLLNRGLKKIGGVRVTSTSARWSAVQGVLSRGDRRLADVLYDMQVRGLSWNGSLKKNGLSQEFYLYRARRFDELLPWDHLEAGISKARLMEQFKCAQSSFIV